MTTTQKCRFCGSADGEVLAERVEGLHISRGHVPMVTAIHHRACLDAFVANEARLRAEARAELEAEIAALRAEMAR